MSVLSPESRYLDDEFVVAIASAVAGQFYDGRAFVHRRVESVAVPAPERPNYRRQISVDFSIPDVPALPPSTPLPEPSEHEPELVPTECDYLLPLALISRWPPLFSLDLRDPAGQPIPFLTWEQNKQLDSAVLAALAARVCGVSIADLSNEIAAEIDAVVSARGAEGAFETLFGTLLPIVEAVPDEHLDAHRRLLRRSQPFTALASNLCTNSLLWFPVRGSVGDRLVVKYAFEDPWEHADEQTLRQTLGLVPFIVKFPCPFIGDSESYHLSVTAPEPLRLVDARLVIRRASTPASHREHTLVDYTTAGPQRTTPHLTAYATQSSTKAKFYAVGRRLGCEAEASVAIEVDTRGFLHGAIGASLAVTIIVAAFAFNLSATVHQADAAVATLLIGPGLLAYVLVRPSEHVLVGGFVRGLRRLLIGSGVLPIGAALIVTLASKHITTGEVVLLKLDALGLALTTLAFAMARFLPKRDWAMPLSTQKWQKISERHRRRRSKAISARTTRPR